VIRNPRPNPKTGLLTLDSFWETATSHTAAVPVRTRFISKWRSRKNLAVPKFIFPGTSLWSGLKFYRRGLFHDNAGFPTVWHSWLSTSGTDGPANVIPPWAKHSFGFLEIHDHKSGNSPVPFQKGYSSVFFQPSAIGVIPGHLTGLQTLPTYGSLFCTKIGPWRTGQRTVA